MKTCKIYWDPMQVGPSTHAPHPAPRSVTPKATAAVSALIPPMSRPPSSFLCSVKAFDVFDIDFLNSDCSLLIC